MARSQTLAFAFTLSLAACVQAPEAPNAPEPAAPEEPLPPLPIDFPARTAALDLRYVRIAPERFVGQERLCDVSFAGELSLIGAADADRYPEGIALRRSIQCRASGHDLWADLTFDEPARALAETLSAGRRLRVRIMSATGGFEDSPILAFVADTGPLRELPPNGDHGRPLLAGDDIVPSQLIDGRTYDCRLERLDAIRIIDGPRVVRAARHRAWVGCRGASGVHWVEIEITPDELAYWLTLRRDLLVTIRIVRARGSTAGLPTGQLVQPEPVFDALGG